MNCKLRHILHTHIHPQRTNISIHHTQSLNVNNKYMYYHSTISWIVFLYRRTIPVTETRSNIALKIPEHTLKLRTFTQLFSVHEHEHADTEIGKCLEPGYIISYLVDFTSTSKYWLNNDPFMSIPFQVSKCLTLNGTF